MPGTTEILIIGGIVLVLFGASAIPKFFRSIGKAQAEFHKGQREGQEDVPDADTRLGAEPAENEPESSN